MANPAYHRCNVTNYKLQIITGATLQLQITSYHRCYVTITNHKIQITDYHRCYVTKHLFTFVCTIIVLPVLIVSN